MPAGAANSGAAFLQISPSARAHALGRANGITALGAEAIGANPANLGLMPKRFEVLTSYAALLDGTQFQHVAAAMGPRQEGWFDGLGLSATRLRTSGLQDTNSSGNLTGASFGGGDLAVSLAGSSKITASLRVGLGIKVLQSEIAGYRSNKALAGDAGLTYVLGKGHRPLSIGLSVTNFGQGLRFVEQTDPLPTMINLGLAMPFGPAMAVVEVNRLISDQQTQASLGIEYGLGSVSLRAGYLVVNQAGDLARPDQKGGSMMGGISGGVGIKFGAARLDYAMSQQSSDYGATQRVALSFQWGRRARAQDRSDWRFDEDRFNWLMVIY